MASFTGVGDNVTLNMTHKGDTAAVAISGTYAMEIALQKEVGSPGSGAWITLKSWAVANATVAYDHTTSEFNERLRLIVLVDTSGTATATLTDTTDLVIEEVRDPTGYVRMRWYQDGPVFYNQSGEVTYDGRQSEKFIIVPDAATYAALARNSGKVHIIPDLTASCTITLPTPDDGLEFTFEYGGVAADAQNWVISSGSNTNFFKGGALHNDSDAGAGADELVPVYPNGTTNSKVTHATPGIGSRLTFRCDGTNWYVSGMAVSVTAPVFADQ